jgi:hypothetical protein
VTTQLYEQSYQENLGASPQPDNNVGLSPRIETDEEVARREAALELKRAGDNYKSKFMKTWIEVQKQINCTPPADWSDKEEWQTQIMIPLQFKTAELSSAILSEMVFGDRRFYAFSGIDSQDRELETNLTRFIDILLNSGGFWIQNGYVLQESCNIGTSFMKMMINPKKPGLIFKHRSPKDCSMDSIAVSDFEDSRYFSEDFQENIVDILNNPLYENSKKNDLLIHLGGKNAEKGDRFMNLAASEGATSHKINKKYQDVDITEFWGYLPVKKIKKINGSPVEYMGREWRVLTIADKTIVLRDNYNDYETIPYVRGRTKRKLYHGYGNGFCANVIGVQDLVNSLVNIGMDTLKIHGIGILVIDEDNVSDASSIAFEPLARWRVRNGKMNAIDVKHFGSNKMNEVVEVIGYLDQVHQDATALSRQYQGVEPLYNNSDETLGQTQLKMQAIEKRFLKIAKEYTEDFVVPMLRKVFRIITNPKFVDRFQTLANRTIGIKEIPNPLNEKIILEAQMTGQEPQLLPPLKVPKLDLKQIGEIGLDFKATGMLHFAQKNELPAQMEKLLNLGSKMPSIGILLRMEQVLKTLLQTSNIPDYQDYIRPENERAMLVTMIQEQMRANMNNEMVMKGISKRIGNPPQRRGNESTR